ncbi:MAG: ThuA domain-containing protein [Planctomycetia bacterium]|nr:ThuA domain-containing protein [Planctomycetia bacterium]
MSRRYWLAWLLVLLLVSPSWAQAKKKLLLVGQGPDGHPPETHEYLPGVKVLGRCLEKTPDLEITTVDATGPWKNGPELIERSDAVVLFVSEGAKWLQADPERHKALAKLAQRGGGLVCLHWAMGTREAEPIAPYLKLFGGCHGGPDRKYVVVEVQAEVADPQSPVATGIRDFKVKDEFYYRLKFVQPEGSIKPVLQVPIDGRKETVAWTWERPDGGRSFGFSGLHFHSNWKLPEYRRLVAQATLWTLKLPIPKDGLPVEIKDDDLALPKAAGK